MTILQTLQTDTAENTSKQRQWNDIKGLTVIPAGTSSDELEMTVQCVFTCISTQTGLTKNVNTYYCEWQKAAYETGSYVMRENTKQMQENIL